MSDSKLLILAFITAISGLLLLSHIAKRPQPQDDGLLIYKGIPRNYHSCIGIE